MILLYSELICTIMTSLKIPCAHDFIIRYLYVKLRRAKPYIASKILYSLCDLPNNPNNMATGTVILASKPGKVADDCERLLQAIQVITLEASRTCS